MWKYVLKRVLFLIPTIIGVTFIIYFVMSLTPSDPGRAILGSGVSQADIDAYNHAIGYDLPFFQKFINYLTNMFFHGDFGTSYVTKQVAGAHSEPLFFQRCSLRFSQRRTGGFLPVYGQSFLFSMSGILRYVRLSPSLRTEKA